MDDLAKKLSDLLSSPDGMQKIQSMASSLGMLTGGDSTEGSGSAPRPSAEPVSAGVSPALSMPDNSSLGDIETIKKLLPLLSNLKGDDENTLLLKALRPYLQDDRQQRLDETIKIMHLLKVLPLLGEKGIL